jgi:hypothetical protein
MGRGREIYVYNILVVKPTEKSPLGMEHINEISRSTELVNSH